MLQVVENINELFIGVAGGESICALIGEKSGKLIGIKVTTQGKVRLIYFPDIDRMKQILDSMGGET